MYELIQKVKKLCHQEKRKLLLGDGYVYDFVTHSLTGADGDTALAKKEILFLELLAQDEHRIVSFEEIEEYVWEGEPTTLINIRALVKRLRKKIPQEAIKIVKGLGYGLSASCEKISS